MKDVQLQGKYAL